MMSFDEILAQARVRGFPLVIAELGAKSAPLPEILSTAKLACEAGADMVKFQTFNADNVTTEDAVFRGSDGSEVSQKDYFRRYQFSPEEHHQLIEGCRRANIPWFSTPSSPADVDLLEMFEPTCYKTGSDDLTNLILLRAIARTSKPVLLSTGMSDIEQVERAVATVLAAGGRIGAVLHCVTSYPSRPEDANLRAIQTMRDRLGFPIGLSDHTVNAWTSVLATTLGAEVIEKHFTPDHALKWPDDEVCLDPAEWRDMIEQLRMVPAALGNGIKRIQESEIKWHDAARKSLFATRDLSPGTIISEKDLKVLRPLIGIPVEDVDKLVGCEVRIPVAKGDPITWAKVTQHN
jgi:N,N'-diacetyllegionaminate synthase